MKISEILEAGLAYKLGQTARTVKDVSTDFKSQYDKGRAAMDRVMSPSKWLSGDQKSPAGKPIPGFQIRQSLINAGSGKSLYQDDMAALKAAYSDAEDPATQQAIKRAFSSKALDKNQQQLLLAQSKKY